MKKILFALAILLTPAICHATIQSQDVGSLTVPSGGVLTMSVGSTKMNDEYFVAYASGAAVKTLAVPFTVSSNTWYHVRVWTAFVNDTNTTQTGYFSSATFNNDNGANYSWQSIGYTGISGASQTNQTSANSPTTTALPLCMNNGNAGDIKAGYWCQAEMTFFTPPGYQKEISIYGSHQQHDYTNARWYFSDTFGGGYSGASNVTSIQFGAKSGNKINIEVLVTAYAHSLSFQ